jgi:hypothetical protein
MKALDKKIEESCINSKKLREIYLGTELSYNKSIELQKQQNNEYKKMMFFKNLKKELEK